MNVFTTPMKKLLHRKERDDKTKQKTKCIISKNKNIYLFVLIYHFLILFN